MVATALNQTARRKLPTVAGTGWRTNRVQVLDIAANADKHRFFVYLAGNCIAVLLDGLHRSKHVLTGWGWIMLAVLLPLVAVAQDDGESDPADNAISNILNDGLLQSDYRIELQGIDGKDVLTNITLEELKRLEQLAKSVSQLPPATLVQADVTVAIKGEMAEVEARFDVQLGASKAPAIVDLRMGSCKLSELPEKPVGEVQSLFQVNPKGPGYQWLLLGEANQRYSLVLKGRVPVRQKSGRNTLSLDLPTTLTKLNIALPSNAVDARLRSDDVSERTETADGIALAVSSRGGDFTLSWREQGALQRVAAVEAESTTTFDILDPQQPWSCTTTLNVRAYGSESGTSFRIRLPAGAQWRTYPSPEFDRFRITTVLPSSELSAANREASGDDPSNTSPINEEASVDVGTSNAISPMPQVPNDWDPQREAEELLVERIDTTSNEAIPLLLEWEWLPDNTSNDLNTTEVRIPIPTISDVDVHKGTVNCVYPASYAAGYREGASSRLVQQGRLPNLFGRQQLQFQFDRQDFELSVSLRREQSLPTVRPTYKVSVDRHKLVLTAWFNCSFDTSRQQMEIGLIPGDWIIEENTARVLSDVNDPQSAEAEVLNVRRQENGNYVFSYSGREPEAGFGASRRIEQLWRVVAERSWNPDDNQQLEFQIPILIRGAGTGLADADLGSEVDHGSGVVLVLSDNNIINRWRETASTGLLPDSFSTEYQKFVPEARLREPLAYRFQSRGTTPTWAGQAEFLPQQISTEQHAIVEVLPTDILVKQDFELRVANEPLDRLRLAVHANVKQVPQVFVNGNLASLQPTRGLKTEELKLESRPSSVVQASAAVPVTSPNPPDVEWREYEIVGSPNLIGAIKVSILTNVPWRNDKAVENGGVKPEPSMDVPLAQLLFPTATRHVRQDWTLVSDYSVDVTSLEDGNAIDMTNSATRRRSLGDKQLMIPLRLRKRESPTAAAVSVTGSWLQSVISSKERRDRFVARVTSDSGKLLIRLPGSAQVEKVAIDGIPVDQPLAPYDYNTKSLTITLPSEPIAQPHVIELFYFMDETLSWLSQMRIEAPVIEGAVNLDRFYWQLVVPRLHHLAWSPSGLTAEWTWQWNGMWWHRQSGEDQATLERWLGGSAQTRQSLSSNNYVMSGQGEFEPQNIRILSRFALWLPVGTLAIVMAMLFINFARLRHPSVAILIAGLLASLAMIWPDIAVLFGQTALLAIALVALVFVTQVAIDSRVRRRSVFTTRPVTHFESSEQASAARGSRPSLTGPLRSGSSVVAVEER